MTINIFKRLGDWLKRASSRPEVPREAPVKLRCARYFRGDYSLNGSEVIFAAVSRISNALATMPIQLYKGTTPINNELNDLLRYSPNPNMTAFTFFRAVEACRDTEGNAYVLKVVDENMAVTRLDVLDPSRVTPQIDTDSQELWYRIMLENGKTVYLHNWYVLHFAFVSTSGISGVSPINVLRDTLDYDRHIKEFSVQQLEKGVNATVALEAPTSLGGQQRQKAVSDFLETYKSTGGGIMLLESGITAKTLNLSPVDTKVLEVSRITRNSVATVYNIPPHLLGYSADSNFNGMTEQVMLEFMSLTMLPIVIMYEQELNRKLLTAEQRRQGYYWKFNTEAIMRADAKTQAEVDQMAIRSARKTPNEIRRRNGDPDDPNGNDLLCSRDLTRLSLIAQETFENQTTGSMGGK